MFDFRDLWSLFTAADSSVGAVLASDVDSTEFKVEVRLCLEAERRIVLVGREGFGLGLSDLTEL
jgi:hypothetical protein